MSSESSSQDQQSSTAGLSRNERVDRLIIAFEHLSDLMAARIEAFSTILRRMRIERRIQIGTIIATLIVLVVVMSAVMPGVPVLRIFERNQARTNVVLQRVFHNQQCTVLWANDKRDVFICADVFKQLDELEKNGVGKS